MDWRATRRVLLVAAVFLGGGGVESTPADFISLFSSKTAKLGMQCDGVEKDGSIVYINCHELSCDYVPKYPPDHPRVPICHKPVGEGEECNDFTKVCTPRMPTEWEVKRMTPKEMEIAMKRLEALDMLKCVKGKCVRIPRPKKTKSSLAKTMSEQ
ncbi:hypothetical protein SYNPS1DRAFT_30954 [Syncephalis pseudoplumigaleata]|uniref:Uncharacterized protein n=1 Tax=Syncephalis pseudoplumigaleata TaxID=1712513 RepID=A0A4P9YTQ5_9FUNG|nr:hypothetical protein SYNPS1DRAFT_30954 [Syncephalis pseudoplumigaleata]|eukprot:RKP23316.1 hypothetical protein SYNPS1DRAFT_30954 [Syncephalis pseudoplumigaleata]